MSNAVIEVVLGLVFVFFLLSLLCSGINELIANVLGKRADFLAAGIWSLLQNSQDDAGRMQLYRQFWEHPLIRQLGQTAPTKTGLVRDIWRGLCGVPRSLLKTKHLRAVLPPSADPRQFEPDRLRPSYISPHIFATVVRAIVRDGAAPPNSSLGISLQALIDEAGTERKALNAALGQWYDAQMERVSEWYKRESKRVLVYIAVPVVVALNVDTVSIAHRLWTNPTLRATVADAAQQQIQAAATSTTMPGGAAAGAQPAVPPPIPCPADDEADAAEPTTTTTATTLPPDPATVVARALDCIRSIPLPIGWPAGAVPRGWDGWLLRLVGWALTIGALTFGAPFWFDLLNRVGSLRAAGAKPKTSTET